MFVNLTPHSLNIIGTNGDVVTVPPSGSVARVSTQRVAGPQVDGIDTYRVTFGQVEGLPEPVPGTILIVSGMVAARVCRDDVFAPGELVRDSAGQPTGCKGLTCSG